MCGIGVLQVMVQNDQHTQFQLNRMLSLWQYIAPLHFAYSLAVLIHIKLVLIMLPPFSNRQYGNIFDDYIYIFKINMRKTAGDKQQ